MGWNRAWRRRVGLAAVSGFVVVLLSGCWLQPRFGPEAQNFNPLEETITSANVGTLRQAWQVETEFGGALVRGGRVLTGGSRGVGGEYVTGAEALSLETGATVWSRQLYSTQQAGQGWEPTIVNGEVWLAYLPSGDPPAQQTTRVRLDPDDGSTVGSLVDDSLGVVPVDAGRIMVDLSGGRFSPRTPMVVTVRDPTTTEVLWSASPPLSEYGHLPNPVVAHGQIYVSDGDRVYAFDADGCGAPTCPPVWDQEIWEGDTSSFLRLVAATDDGHLVIYRTLPGGDRYRPTTQTHLVVLTSSGSFAWDTPTSGSTVAGGVAVAGDVVYLEEAVEYPDGDPRPTERRLYAYATATGARLWSAELDTSQSTPGGVVVAGDVVYVNAPGAVLAFHREGCGAPACTPIASIPVPEGGGVATVAQGHLLVRSGNVLTAYVPA
jgi:hypothetical protein